MTKITIPYFHLYAADYKAFKDKLSPEEFIQIIDAMSDICLFGETDFKPQKNMQKMFFEKLLENQKKSIKKYKASSENGKKGGRPKKPTGSSQVKLNVTQVKPIEEKRREENIKEEKKYESEYVNQWNGFASKWGLAKIKSLTDTRKANLIARRKEHGNNFLLDALANIENSPFLLGQTKDWKVDFDFVVSKSGCLKILEGKYNDTKRGSDKELKRNILEISGFEVDESNSIK